MDDSTAIKIARQETGRRFVISSSVIRIMQSVMPLRSLVIAKMRWMHFKTHFSMLFAACVDSMSSAGSFPGFT
jgi:hypothetical protein